METRSLERQVVLVTGGISGVGAACGCALSGAGAGVGLGGRRGEALKKLADEGGGARLTDADCRSPCQRARR